MYLPFVCRTESGVQLPVHTLEFDVGVTGPTEAVVSLVAALTNAFSQISSSQLQAASDDSSGASREARRVRAVAMAEFKPLHLVGKALSHFVGAYLTLYRSCRKTSSQMFRDAQTVGKQQERRPRRDAHMEKPRPTVEETVQKLRAGGSLGCHLPLVILKPRFVVHKVPPHAERGKATASKHLHVEVLPVISDIEGEGGGQKRYRGPRARRFTEDAGARQQHPSIRDGGIPIILFR